MRTHELKVKVDHNKDWQEAINAISNDTPEYYDVRKVSDLYPPSEGKVEQELILINFPEGGSWEQALQYAKEHKLELTTPREVFAIGEQHPNLHTTLGMNPMYVVATTECAFEGRRRACHVWWLGSEREADLRWVGYFSGRDGWFAFRKSSDSVLEPSLSSALPEILEINSVKYRRE